MFYSKALNLDDDTDFVIKNFLAVDLKTIKLCEYFQ